VTVGDAWNLVRTVSTGWHIKTDTAPDTHPATKSTYASERLLFELVMMIGLCDGCDGDECIMYK
jgi:hypothetical protein